MSLALGNSLRLSGRHNGMNAKLSMSRMLIAMFSAVLLLASCGGSSLSSDVTPTSVADAPLVEPSDKVVDSTATSLTMTSTLGEEPNDYIAAVVADAAQSSGAPIEAMTVTLAEAVQWRDGSLGCPEPGSMYTQAVVDGFRIVVQTPSGELDYRTSGTDFFVVCSQEFGR